MGDHHPRRLSVTTTSFAGSSIPPVLPLHQSRNQEQDARTRQREARSSEVSSGHELLDLGASRSKRHQAPRRIETKNLYSYHDNDETASGDESDNTTPHHMPGKKSKSRSPNPRGRRQQQGQTQANGSASSSTASPLSSAEMNGSFRERSKHASSLDVPDDSAFQTARVLGSSAFTLDEAPPPMTPHDKHGGVEGSGSKGFFELPEQDRRNFLLLVLLYFLQGIPMGLAGGSVPFLLKSHLSYGQIGVYSLASYPYSLKLLWSPSWMPSGVSGSAGGRAGSCLYRL